VDFGTSTNFDVVSADGEFVGGVIGPGIQVAAASLVSRTARLPRVELVAPPSVIGKNTVECIQSALIFGTADMVDGIVARISDEPTSTRAIREAHPDLAPDTTTAERFVVAGRVVLKRDLGKLKFLTIRDRDGDLQLVFAKASLPEDRFALLDEVDLGDIIGTDGYVGTTRTGELSIFVERW